MGIFDLLESAYNGLIEIIESLNGKKPTSGNHNLTPQTLKTPITSYEHTINDETKILTEEQRQIKNIIERHEITELVHFTDVANVDSIKKYGILPKAELEQRGLKYMQNDPYRFDKHCDAISISITHINKFLLRSFFYKQILLNPVAFHIDPAILYKEIKTERIYCITNAATHDAPKGPNLSDFEAMFNDKVEYTTTFEKKTFTRKNKSINETTDPQAEILFCGRISPEYFLGEPTPVEIGDFYGK